MLDEIETRSVAATEMSGLIVPRVQLVSRLSIRRAADAAGEKYGRVPWLYLFEALEAAGFIAFLDHDQEALGTYNHKPTP
jgi:hypothetical protein